MAITHLVFSLYLMQFRVNASNILLNKFMKSNAYITGSNEHGRVLQRGIEKFTTALFVYILQQNHNGVRQPKAPAFAYTPKWPSTQLGPRKHRNSHGVRSWSSCMIYFPIRVDGHPLITGVHILKRSDLALLLYEPNPSVGVSILWCHTLIFC